MATLASCQSMMLRLRPVGHRLLEDPVDLVLPAARHADVDEQDLRDVREHLAQPLDVRAPDRAVLAQLDDHAIRQLARRLVGLEPADDVGALAADRRVDGRVPAERGLGGEHHRCADRERRLALVDLRLLPVRGRAARLAAGLPGRGVPGRRRGRGARADLGQRALLRGGVEAPDPGDRQRDRRGRSRRRSRAGGAAGGGASRRRSACGPRRSGSASRRTCTTAPRSRRRRRSAAARAPSGSTRDPARDGSGP